MENTSIPLEVSDKVIKKSNRFLYLLSSLVVILLVIIVGLIFVLITRPSTENQQQSQPLPAISYPQQNLNENNNQNPPAPVQPIANRLPTITNQEAEYSPHLGVMDPNGHEYIAFDYIDMPNSVANHYMITQEQLTQFPILKSAATGQKFAVTGSIIGQGAAAGNHYYTLNGEIKIQAIGTFEGMQADTKDESTQVYVFKSCTNPAPPCMKYLLSESLASGIPLVKTLKENDVVRFSGQVDSEGAAAGTSYWRFTGDVVVEK